MAGASLSHFLTTVGLKPAETSAETSADTSAVSEGVDVAVDKRQMHFVASVETLCALPLVMHQRERHVTLSCRWVEGSNQHTSSEQNAADSCRKSGPPTEKSPCRTPMDDSKFSALRVVHLQGGQRAFDLFEAHVTVGVSEEQPILTIPRPRYPTLYAVLRQIGFSSIGVDVLSHIGEAHGVIPPNWQVCNNQTGFSAMMRERAWTDVRNVPSQKTPELIDFAGRFTTYHRLLSHRVRELSEAYSRALRAALLDLDGKPKPLVSGGLFSNGFLTYIDAAIHGFLADAVCFRDLISEAVWRLVLKESSTEVKVLPSLVKTSKSSREPVVLAIHAAAKDGWLKQLTDLRNGVTHIAPLANAHELHMADLRLKSVGEVTVPYVHYPLTTKDGGMRDRPPRVVFSNDEKTRNVIKEYRAFVAESGDALEYAAATFDRLVGLASDVRLAAGLQSQVLLITDKDIIGPVRIKE